MEFVSGIIHLWQGLYFIQNQLDIDSTMQADLLFRVQDWGMHRQLASSCS